MNPQPIGGFKDSAEHDQSFSLKSTLQSYEVEELQPGQVARLLREPLRLNDSDVSARETA